MDPPDNQDDLSEDEGIGEEDLVEIIDDDEANLPAEVDLAAEVEDLSVDVDIDGAEGGDGNEGAADDEMRDDATVTFAKHTASVFSVSIDPVSSSLAASGGEDDKAYVWKVQDGQTVFECTGHKDSVTCTAFSHDSKLVASGDMSGQIKVWDTQTGQEVWSFECADLEWLEWHVAAHVLLAGTSDGDVWMWRVPSGDTKTFQSHGCRSTCGMFMRDGSRACVGYGDGTFKVWDLKKGAHTFHLSDSTCHQGSLTCLDCHKDGVLVATGSEDSLAKIINTNTGKVVTSLDAGFPNPRQDRESPPSIEAVCFSNVQSVLATGSLSGVLGFWDFSTKRLRQQCKHPASIVRLKWDVSAPLLYSCCLDGVVRMWDSRSGNCEREWLGHTDEVLDLALSRDGSTLITASGDSTAKVFTMDIPGR